MNPLRVTSRPCLLCGDMFRLPLCRLSRPLLCSTPCRKNWHAQQRVQALAQRQRQCTICTKVFHPRQNQLRDGQGIFCSRKCLHASLAGTTQSPEHIAKRIASWKGNPNKRILRGSDNPRFKGGYAVCYKQRLKDGRILASIKRYRAANPHKVREWDQNRRGRKTGRLPKGTVARLYQLQGGRCAACKNLLHGKYHVDHVLAFARGGKHEPHNIQLLCPRCNVRKSAKDQSRFMREMGYLL